MDITAKHTRSTTVVVAAAGMLLAICAALLSASRLQERIDLGIYDMLVRYLPQQELSNIAIVAIDQPSLQALGRWPWSRRVHARLLDRLTKTGALAVGFDVLFSEPEHADPEADAALAAAIQRNARTVLALAPEQGSGAENISESLPLPEFAEYAAALGHVDIELDVDGLCRSTYLKAGLGSAHWPSLSLALKELSAPGTSTPWSDDGLSESQPSPQRAGWVRKHRLLIPFAGPSVHFERYSYVDVLRGRVPKHELEGRVVLVGATAAGLGDAVSTPVALEHDRMPGVELNAHITHALLRGHAIREIPRATVAVITGLSVLVTYMLLLRLPLQFGIGLILLAMTTTVMLTWGGLWFGHLWFAPSAALLGQALSYPVWSGWRLGSESSTFQRLAHRMEHQQTHHAVTDLPNRRMLDAHLARILKTATPTESKLGVLVAHLDPLGMEPRRISAGNPEAFEQAIAQRLRDCLRQGDFLAHLGVDEFAVVMAGLRDLQPVEGVSARITQAFRQPIKENSTDLLMTVHTGACLWPDSGTDPGSLIRNAYTAMEKAREQEIALCVFSEQVNREMTNKSLLERELRQALERNELAIHYQPQVAVGDGRVIGVEALLRWQNPLLGAVTPSKFIPVAERTGLIIPIGEWVLEQACTQMQQWREDGLGDIRVAVNLSPLQITSHSLIDTVAEILRKTRLPPHLLELEVTENALMHDLQTAVSIMSAIRALDVGLSIDDFGTGYSSLSYLKQFPLNRLKIDRSFVTDIGVSMETDEITLAIISMAHKLNLQVIAEGVESPDQREFLRSNACDEFQGFLYSKPLTAKAFEAFMSSTRGHLPEYSA